MVVLSAVFDLKKGNLNDGRYTRNSISARLTICLPQEEKAGKLTIIVSGRMERVYFDGGLAKDKGEIKIKSRLICRRNNSMSMNELKKSVEEMASDEAFRIDCDDYRALLPELHLPPKEDDFNGNQDEN